MRWYSQLLRITLFPTVELQTKSFEQMWADVVGQMPETDEAKPRERSRRQVGSVDDNAILDLHAQPSRIDLLLTTQPTENSPIGELDPVEDRLPFFLNLVGPWLSQGTIPFSRVALGCVLLGPATTREEGYKTILTLVPSLQFDPTENIRDFLYQINRPRDLNVIPERKCNRIMKWSVARVQAFRIAVTDGSSSGPTESIEEHYCRLELDINSAATADMPALDSQKIGPIFEEFAGMALEISSRGELA